MAFSNPRDYTIILNLISEFTQIPKKVKQGDNNSTVLHIQIIDGITPVNLTGLTYTVSIEKPDKTVVYQIPTLVDATLGKLDVVLASQSLAVGGTARAEVSLFDGLGGKLTTFDFEFIIQPNVDTTSAVESSDYLPAIEDAVSKVHVHTNKTTLDKIPDSTGQSVDNVLAVGAGNTLVWAVGSGKIKQNRIVVGAYGTGSFAVGITGYSSTTDVLLIQINGSLIYEGVHWSVSGSTVTLLNSYTLDLNDEVIIVCVKGGK